MQKSYSIDRCEDETFLIPLIFNSLSFVVYDIVQNSWNHFGVYPTFGSMH